MKNNIILFIFSLLFCFSTLASAEDNVIIMGFKDGAKMPLIGELNDNSGLYQELFSKAAEMIGYKLNIVRLPKKRLYNLLKKGEIDFYPGASFSEERAKFMNFMNNGLETKEVILTNQDITEIKDISEASGTLITDRGGSKSNFGDKYKNIIVHEIASLNFKQAITLLKHRGADLYIADIEDVDYYKKIDGLKSYNEIGIKIHDQAFGDFIPMYMGFAMNSKLFKAIKNLKYDKSIPLSYENSPITVSEDCIAYKFHDALIQLKKSGKTADIYGKYFK